jgi:hypothetical protein
MFAPRKVTTDFTLKCQLAVRGCDFVECANMAFKQKLCVPQVCHTASVNKMIAEGNKVNWIISHNKLWVITLDWNINTETGITDISKFGFNSGKFEYF